MKVFEITKAKSPDILIENPKKVINDLEKYYSNSNTLKTKIGAILTYVKDYKDSEAKEDAVNIYLNVVDKYNTDIKNNLASHKKTPEEEKNWTNENDIKQITENLKKDVPAKIHTINDLNKFRNYIIFILYQDIPSRLDIADAKILFKTKKPLNDEHNYIILDRKNKTAVYHMFNYKTKTTYGDKEIQINKDLYKPLEDYKRNVDRFNNDNWFLLNDKGEKLSRNRLSTIYSKLGASIGKKLGISQNRHIHISNLVPIKKMEDLSNKMGNSINEQINVYSKI